MSLSLFHRLDPLLLPTTNKELICFMEGLHFNLHLTLSRGNKPLILALLGDHNKTYITTPLNIIFGFMPDVITALIILPRMSTDKRVLKAKPVTWFAYTGQDKLSGCLV